MTSRMGGQPCGRSALGIGSEEGRLDPTGPAGTTCGAGSAGCRRNGARRTGRRDARGKRPDSAGSTDQRAAGRPRQLPEVLVVPEAAEVVRVLLEEVDDVVSPSSAAIWADWDCSVARVVSMAVNCASIIAW